MKKYFYLLIAAIGLSVAAKAGPGDTTWVQANNVQMTYTGNYDTAVTFPNTNVTYRKILMVFTLGKYVCPGNPQYCGSWDYIVSNNIMTPTDTMEISRLITPYATTSTYFPNTWTYDYVFDVTDYVSLLKGNAVMRINFGGYSYGFSANVRFAFIEGTPDRNVIGLQRLWHGSFSYGVASDPITNHVSTLTESVPANTASSYLKMRITGHGEDGNDCNEFCPNSYGVILNNSNIQTQNFFRTTCGLNPVYTQTGTWIYNRANWCPGALVYDIYNPLPSVTSGTYNLNVTFPAYTTVASSSGNSNPSYVIEATSIYYGTINKTLDASLEEILAPNNLPQYSRSNAVCSEPMIHVHNSGSTPITSLNISYSVAGGYPYNYTWNGSLAALSDTEFALPSPWELRQDVGLATTRQFTATITQVNGQVDNDTTNNTLTSTFSPAMYLQSNKVIIRMKTSAVNQYAESWQILNANDSVVAERTNTQQKTLYSDTVSLNYECYKLVVSTPDGAGLWYGNYFSGNSGDNGTLTFYKWSGSNYLVTTLPNYRGGDFGTGFTQQFSTSPFPLGVTNIAPDNLTLSAYPNPAQSSVTIDINGTENVNGIIKIVDMVGRTVLEKQCNSTTQTINVGELANGMYTVIFYNKNDSNNKLQTRIVVAK